jgi:hypothetical protein
MGLISVAPACRFAVEASGYCGGVAAGIFLIAGWYYRKLHQKPHTLFSVALIEIKRGDMVWLAQGLTLIRAGEITPLHVNYLDYAAALAHSQLMVLTNGLGSISTKLKSQTFSHFEIELFCGRYDSTLLSGTLIESLLSGTLIE